MKSKLCAVLTILLLAQAGHASPIFSNIFGIGNNIVNGLGSLIQGGTTWATQVVASGTAVVADGFRALDSALQASSRQLYSVIWTLSNIGVGTLGNTTGLIRDGSLGTISFLNVTLNSVLDSTREITQQLNKTGTGASVQAAQRIQTLVQNVAATMSSINGSLVNLQNAVGLNNTITVPLQLVIGNLTALGNNLTAQLTAAANPTSSNSLLSQLNSTTLNTLQSYLGNATAAVNVATTTISQITGNLQDPISQVNQFLKELANPTANSSAAIKNIRKILDGINGLVPLAVQSVAQGVTTTIQNATGASLYVANGLGNFTNQTYVNLQNRVSSLNNFVASVLLLPISQLPLALNVALSNLNTSIANTVADVNKQVAAIASSTGRQASSTLQPILDGYIANLGNTSEKVRTCAATSVTAVTTQAQNGASALQKCYNTTSNLGESVRQAGSGVNVQLNAVAQQFGQNVNNITWTNPLNVLTSLTSLAINVPISLQRIAQPINTFLQQLTTNTTASVQGVRACTDQVLGVSVKNLTDIQTAYRSCVA